MNTILNNPATVHNTGKTQEQDEMRIARKRAGPGVGFMIHATVFVAVGLLFLAMSQAGITHAGARHAHWPMFPMAGWAIGLFFHGLAVYTRGAFSGIRDAYDPERTATHPHQSQRHALKKIGQRAGRRLRARRSGLRAETGDA